MTSKIITIFILLFIIGCATNNVKETIQPTQTITPKVNAKRQIPSGPSGYPYSIDMLKINQIKLSEKYSSVTKNIGYPIEVGEIKQIGGKKILSCLYRVKEKGYNFRRFYKPNFQNTKAYDLADPHYLVFTFINDYLEIIEGSIPEGSIQYYNPGELGYGTHIQRERKKPFWLDMEDLDGINLGMNEDKVLNVIGNPAQLISLKKDNSKILKRVFYRFREQYSTSGPKKKYTLPDINKNSIAFIDDEGNEFIIEDEIGEIQLNPYSSLNYIMSKKDEEFSFLKGTIDKSVGKNFYFKDMDGNVQTMKKSSVQFFVENGHSKKFTKGVNNPEKAQLGFFLYYKNLDGKIGKIKTENMTKVIVKGREMKILNGELLSMNTSIWSPNSYNVEFQYENGVLTKITKL